MNKIAEIVNSHVSQFIHIKGFGENLVDNLIAKNILVFDQCEHSEELLNSIITEYMQGMIIHYLKKINNILSGKESPGTIIQDTLMLQAQKHFAGRFDHLLN